MAHEPSVILPVALWSLCPRACRHSAPSVRRNRGTAAVQLCIFRATLESRSDARKKDQHMKTIWMHRTKLFLSGRALFAPFPLFLPELNSFLSVPSRPAVCSRCERQQGARSERERERQTANDTATGASQPQPGDARKDSRWQCMSVPPVPCGLSPALALSLSLSFPFLLSVCSSLVAPCDVAQSTSLSSSHK
jgi:hypothetical protein